MKYLIILFFSLTYSEVTNDSLSVLIKEEVAKVLKEVTYIDPLKGKIGGIEINPLYSLAHSDDGLSFSGTLSIFPKNQKAEIAFPFAYLSQNLEEFDPFNLNALKATFRVDAQYRFFMGVHRKGIHFLGGLRYARFISDREYDFNSSGIEVVNYDYENRFGFTFGAGYRIFAQNGLYWGTSFYLGRYIATKNDFIFANFEFFKVGMTF